MKYLSILILSFFCLLNQLTVAQQNSVTQFIQTESLDPANTAVLLVDIKTGKEISSYEKDKLLIPASILKIITTATALEIYGPDFQIETRLEYTGTIDSNGTLNGDIYIRGGGDPTLGSEHIGRNRNVFLEDCLAAIKKAGIKNVEGRVFADETCFDSQGVSPKWLQEDSGNYFAAGSYGLSFCDNTYRLYLKSGNTDTTPEIIRTEPETGIQFFNYAKSGNSNDAYIYGIPFINKRWVFGTVPANKVSFFVKGDIPDPALYIATRIHETLTHAGIQISKKPSTYRLAQINKESFNFERKLLYTSYSPKLFDIIHETNVKSNNHYAEHLFKLIALSKYMQASFDNATETVVSFWKSKGIDLSNLYMYDGSGLSPVNRVSPQNMIDVLVYMQNKSAYSKEFLASLPEAGKEGTVRNFLKNPKPKGTVHLKSGSISNVQCYAGYINADSKQYAFCIMANHYGISRNSLKKAMEKMILAW